jgi:hypothetical protein
MRESLICSIMAITQKNGRGIVKREQLTICWVLILTSICLIAATFSSYAMTEEEAMEKCLQMADDQEVPGHELEDYICQCIWDMMSESID